MNFVGYQYQKEERKEEAVVLQEDENDGEQTE